MKVLVISSSILLTTVALVVANKYLPSINLVIHHNSFINGLLKYQLFALLIAFLVIFITVKVAPESKILLQFGNLNKIPEKEIWLGIDGKSNWKSNAIQFSIFVSIATSIFMFLGVQYSNSLGSFKWSFVPIILIVSLANSFSEEIIYRFAANGNLMNSTPKLNILILSAILFGLPHYFGYPNGITGVIMAGVLGYILSKITYETQGIGVAWTIHFIQDVIIFTALLMMNTNNSIPQNSIQ